MKALLGIFCVLALTACTISTSNTERGEGNPPETLDISRLIPSNFDGGATQIISLTSNGDNWTWNDPHVVKTGSQYWMYASATDNFDGWVKIYRLVSGNGIDWTHNPISPVLDTGEEGSWDAGAVETPAVVFYNGAYHLFWTGYRYHHDDVNFKVEHFRIGHAVSEDGINFTRDASFLLGPSGTSDAEAANDWYAFIVGEPAPVVFNGALYLYFTAVGADTGADLDMGPGASLQVLGLMVSNDGITWGDPVRVLRPEQGIYPRKPDAGNDYWAGYSTPFAIALENEMHLFFDVARQYDVPPEPIMQDWIQERLHHARSADGIGGWTQDSSPIKSKTDFTWTEREIRSPSALLDGTTLKLYFAGDSLYFNNDFGIGLMTCELGND